MGRESRFASPVAPRTKGFISSPRKDDTLQAAIKKMLSLKGPNG